MLHKITRDRLGREAQSEIWMERKEGRGGEGGFKGQETEGDSDRAE